MHCKPLNTATELEALLNTVVDPETSPWRVLDMKTLQDRVMRRLAATCLLGTDAARQVARSAVRHISHRMGTPAIDAIPFLEAVHRDENPRALPYLNVDHIPYELLEILICAGNDMEVGPLLFTVTPGTDRTADAICAVQCAAVRKQWQAPVLFLAHGATIPVDTICIDWQRMLYFNSHDLPPTSLENLLGDIAKTDLDQLTPAHWRTLMDRPDEAWECIFGEIYDVFCDMFEELDLNETFPMVKRHAIPRWIVSDAIGSGPFESFVSVDKTP